MKLIKTIFYAICIFIILVTAIFYTTNPISDKYKLMVVMSGSMEPKLKVNDIILVHNLDEYKEGDIITFYAPSSVRTTTHRIVDITDGMYKTKGDSNNAVDADIISKDNIVGKQIFKIPLIGAIMVFAQKIPCGYIIIAITIVTSIFISMIVYDLMDEKKKKE